MTKLISTLLFVVASLHAVAATPLAIRDDVPEVIPGPGLPSLESLGLTSADLYAMGMPQTPGDQKSIAALPTCGPEENRYTPVGNIIACYNYLNSIGNNRCGVTGFGEPVIEFCFSGGSQVIGQSLSGRDESSACRDVALAVLYTVDHCTRPQQDVAGFAVANGNGNIVVGAQRRL